MAYVSSRILGTVLLIFGGILAVINVAGLLGLAPRLAQPWVLLTLVLAFAGGALFRRGTRPPQ